MSKFLRNGKIVAAVLVVLLLVVVGVAGVLTFQKVQNHELTIPEHSRPFCHRRIHPNPPGTMGLTGRTQRKR